MNKKKIFNYVLLFILNITLLSFIFMYAYGLGHGHKYNHFLARHLPYFLFDEEHGKSTLNRTFVLSSTFEGENVFIVNTITYPHTWSFRESRIENDESATRQYIIASEDGNIRLVVIPKEVNDFRSVMSATTVLTQDIKRKCLGSYSVSEFRDFDFITLYRENINEDRVEYIQEVNSGVDPVESSLALDEFLIFKRQGGFIEGAQLVWTAEIYLEFEESILKEEKEAYLTIVDEIVSSLQIK